MGANPEEVVIDAEGWDSVFGIWQQRVVLSGLTITGGYSDSWGGGIYLTSGDCRIDNCVVRGNQSQTMGGGLFIGMYAGGFAELNDCIIYENYASEQGGGIFMTSQYGGCEVTATHCLISSNVSPIGAGIAATVMSLELVDSVVADNVAESEGAGLGVGHYSTGLLELDAENCLFISNRTLDGTGGAAFVGLYATGFGARFSGSTFISNTAQDGGSALCAKTGENYSLPGVELTDCIFRDGGSEIWEEQPGLVVVENSCIEGGWDGRGQGNFDADPLFVWGPLGDYYLSQMAAGQAVDSPCVDAGSMNAYSAGIAEKTTRTDGSPDTGIVDLGFHYPTLLMMPEVWVSTPSETYSHGDTLEMVFEAINPNPFSYPVDLYAAVIGADGVIWTIDTGWVWSASLDPWFASLELPANFTFGPTTLLTLPIPSDLPPISASGTYWAAAAFAKVGTTSFIGEPSLSPFGLTAD